MCLQYLFFSVQLPFGLIHFLTATVSQDAVFRTRSC